MDQLSLQIGALELSHVAASFDDMLEAASQANPQATSIYIGAPCRRFDDAREVAGRQVGPVPTHVFPHCISDG